ncbi:MAG: hypothetical protein AAF483_14335 [Planctomycetota bacterium]
MSRLVSTLSVLSLLAFTGTHVLGQCAGRGGEIGGATVGFGGGRTGGMTAMGFGGGFNQQGLQAMAAMQRMQQENQMLQQQLMLLQRQMQQLQLQNRNLLAQLGQEPAELNRLVGQNRLFNQNGLPLTATQRQFGQGGGAAMGNLVMANNALGQQARQNGAQKARTQRPAQAQNIAQPNKRE